MNYAPIFMTTILIQCSFCKKEFKRSLRDYNLFKKRKYKLPFCSTRCGAIFYSNKRIEKICALCKKQIFIKPCEIKKRKNSFFFCSHACRASFYNLKRGPMSKKQKEKISNSLRGYQQKWRLLIPRKRYYCRTCLCLISIGFTHAKYCKKCLKKIHVNKALAINKSLHRRSKEEDTIYQAIIKKYPTLKIIPNDTTIIGDQEVDIAIHDYKLAIEYNGVFHYQPILGEKFLQRYKSLDLRKNKKLKELGWHLLTIKAIHHRNFINMFEYYLQMIDNEINFLKSH